MINPIHQIAKLITEYPDIINHNILLESLESKIKKLLTKISNQLPHEINIDEITQFSTQQRFKELGVSRWIAKQVAFNPSLRVDWSLLTDYIAHLKFRDNNKYKTLLKKKIQEVTEGAEKWHSQSQNNEPIIAEFPNGYRIVKLTKKEHCETEGELMDNCVKDYDPKETDLYSLRSPDGKPKVTIQVLKDGRVNELKGRQNKPPVKKYAELIIPWVNSILKEPEKLFVDPDVNFAHTGFEDYVGSLHNEGLLLKLTKSKNPTVREAVAHSLNAPVNILRILSKDENWSVRSRVAGNPNIPIDLLRTLSKDENCSVKLDIAENPNTPHDILIDILKSLANDKDEDLRYWVARNPNATVDVLKILAHDKQDYIKIQVLDHPNVSSEILRLLAKDDEVSVRYKVARNPNAPVDILRSLSKDDYTYTRVAVVRNPNTPIDILKSLANDNRLEVKNELAYRRDISADILEILATSGDFPVQAQVAKHPNVTPDILRLLVDGCYWIRKILAKSPKAPLDVLKSLRKDKNQEIRDLAYQNFVKRQK